MSSIPSGLAANAPDVEADMAQSQLILHPYRNQHRKSGTLSFCRAVGFPYPHPLQLVSLRRRYVSQVN